MIEEVILNKLKNLLDVPIYLEEPKKKLDKFVIFEKTSSSKENLLLNSTFAFQSYANSMYESAKLNEQVKNAVEKLIMYDEFSKIKLNSDYNFTDTSKERYRYQAVYDIWHY